MTIEINGIEYQKIEKRETRSSEMAGYLVAMASMFGGSIGSGSKPRERPTVNLIEEYGLIQKKKSKLSRNNRDWVIYQFERQYKRINH